MTMTDALDIITNPNIPCADRIRAAMSIGLEPRNSCEALRHAHLELDRLRFLRLADEPGISLVDRTWLIEQADVLLSIPF